jgi:hypothetical protein
LKRDGDRATVQLGIKLNKKIQVVRPGLSSYPKHDKEANLTVMGVNLFTTERYTQVGYLDGSRYSGKKWTCVKKRVDQGETN